MPEEIRALVRPTDDKTPQGADGALMDRLLFRAKEAVFKVVFPLEHVMLKYEDIWIDFVQGRAETTTGRGVELGYALNFLIWVLAYPKGYKLSLIHI